MITYCGIIFSQPVIPLYHFSEYHASTSKIYFFNGKVKKKLQKNNRLLHHYQILFHYGFGILLIMWCDFFSILQLRPDKCFLYHIIGLSSVSITELIETFTTTTTPETAPTSRVVLKILYEIG